jgi:hypothetical protein
VAVTEWWDEDGNVIEDPDLEKWEIVDKSNDNGNGVMTVGGGRSMRDGLDYGD